MDEKNIVKEFAKNFISGALKQLMDETIEKEVGEIINNVLEFCLKECGGEGDCLNCGQKPINVEIADKSIISLIEREVLKARIDEARLISERWHNNNIEIIRIEELQSQLENIGE